MNSLLSIITPVYNVEAYLDRCVHSIVSQSYSNIELILVDDGSTDSSAIKCEEWAAKDSRIKVVRKDNGGVSSARNIGLEMARGDYLTFVDPDDFLAPDTYLYNMDYLLSHRDVDILQYPYCNYVSENEACDYHIPKEALLSGKEQVFRSWWSGTPIEYVIWNKIYKRTLWTDIRFNVGHISEDTCLVPLFVNRTRTFFISEQGLYYYQRARENSYTFNYSFDKHIDLFNAHAEIYECFVQFPDMVTEKVMAFTRLYRRLITAKQTEPSADISMQLEIINQKFPTWMEIFKSNNTDKIWLVVSKVLGANLFVFLFLKYLKRE